jgi:hypothetical protein
MEYSGETSCFMISVNKSPPADAGGAPDASEPGAGWRRQRIPSRENSCQWSGVSFQSVVLMPVSENGRLRTEDCSLG